LKLSFAFGAEGLKQIDFLHLALVNGKSEQSAASIPLTLATLHLTSRRYTTHHLRDGEVVLYMRPDSGVWQVCYKAKLHQARATLWHRNEQDFWRSSPTQLNHGNETFACYRGRLNRYGSLSIKTKR